MLLKYIQYSNIYNVLAPLHNLTDLQHVVRCVCKIVLLALTLLKLSPGRIKLAILSIDKLKSSLLISQNSKSSWLNLIQEELLVDFTPDELNIINAGLVAGYNPLLEENGKYVYKRNPVRQLLGMDICNAYLNGFQVNSSSIQTNLLYGMVCILLEDVIQREQVDDIIYILSSISMSTHEQVNELLHRLDDIQLCRVLKYKIPV